MSDVCKKCFHLIDAFMQMCPQGGLCESAPPQPVAERDEVRSEVVHRAEEDVKAQGAVMQATPSMPSPGVQEARPMRVNAPTEDPSPAAATQPEPKPAPQGFEKWWPESPDYGCDRDYEGVAREAWSAAQAPLLEKIAELESAQSNLGAERLRCRMLGLVDGFRAAQPKADPVEKRTKWRVVNKYMAEDYCPVFDTEDEARRNFNRYTPNDIRIERLDTTITVIEELKEQR